MARAAVQRSAPPTKKPKAQASVAVSLERQATVEQMLIRHYSSSEIVSYAKKNWNLEERQAREYITKVYVRWREESQESREDQRERQRRSVLKLIRRATELASRETKGSQGAAHAIQVALNAESLLSRLDGTRHDPVADGGQGDFMRLIPKRKPEVSPTTSGEAHPSLAAVTDESPGAGETH